jgi:hypothetical protein
MNVRITGILVLFLSLFLNISCRRNEYRKNVSSIAVDIEITRLEMDLFTPSPYEIPGFVPELKKKYGSFLQLFSYVINTGDITDSSFGDFLVRYCTDKLNNEVYSEVMRLYPDLEAIEKDLEDAFRHYLWYFPDRNVPAVSTCISGFNNSLITGDSAIGIGLDRYLGTESRFYPMLQIYKYLALRMNSWNIVPDCMYGWGSTEWNFEELNYKDDNVLTEMIHEGKLRYFQKCMLPEISDTLLFGFTYNQTKFCKNNESQMWQYLIGHDLLFSTDQFVMRKLVGEAPFTSWFTNESPGRAATWLGFRIVESYMKRNKDISLGEMMKNTDIQGILEGSRYNPQ